jgi:hypothetical protein
MNTLTSQAALGRLLSNSTCRIPTLIFNESNLDIESFLNAIKHNSSLETLHLQMTGFREDFVEALCNFRLVRKLQSRGFLRLVPGSFANPM